MSVANVDRCLSLIELLAGYPAGIGLSSLAEQLKLPLSDVHRLLGALIARGYVRQDPASHLYQFTLRFAAMGFRFLDAYHLPDAAQGVLDALARDTGDYCRLALVQDGNLTWVARAQGATQALRYDPPMGRPVALHTTASGKAWLASLAEEDALRIVSGPRLSGAAEHAEPGVRPTPHPDDRRAAPATRDHAQPWPRRRGRGG